MDGDQGRDGCSGLRVMDGEDQSKHLQKPSKNDF